MEVENTDPTDLKERVAVENIDLADLKEQVVAAKR